MRENDRVKLLDAITDLCKETARVVVINEQSRCGCSLADETDMSKAQNDLLIIMNELGL